MSHRTALFAAFAVSSAVASGCSGYTDMHVIVLRQPNSAAAHDVQMYLGEQGVPNAFYELAVLQAVGYNGDATTEDMVSALRERGRELGCDAVVRVRVELGYTMAHGYGVCVKWQTPGAKAPAPMSLPG